MADCSSGTWSGVLSDDSLQQLSTWDPASEAFQNQTFNSYVDPESGIEVFKSFKSKQETSEKQQAVLPPEVKEKSFTLFVGNIPLSISQDGLINFFSRAAPVKSARILTSRNPQKRTTYGFVKVSSIEDAGKIIRKFNHYSFGTKYNLFIKLTESDEERARKRERIKEDEECYERAYQEYKAKVEKIGESSSESTSAIDDESVKKKTTRSMEIDTRKRTKTCIACSKEGLKACSRCKACYCSVDCQKSHWPVHQKECGRTRDTQSDKKPMANGIVNHGPGKPSTNVVEDEFLVEMDGYNADSDSVFSIEDIMPQTQLKKHFKAVIYVIEDMLMKGQAVDASETERFLELMQELSQYFTDKLQSLSPGMCKEGVLVLFDYHGEVTRGVVTKFDSSKGEVTVLAIDYGNKETVKVSDLFLMPRFALGCPMQCRTLALYGLPSSIDASTKVSLNEHLKSITQEKIFECNVKGEANGVYTVVITMEDAAESVNDLMVSQYEKLKELKVKVPKRIMLQYMPLQPYPTEPEFDVIVTEVKSPSCFFAQILTKDRSNIIALSQLFNKLQELKTDTDLVDFHPVVDEACLAFFIQDQTWSRAAVERVNPDGTVRVSFIDYGNAEDVDTCYIRPMTKEFSLLPRQARKFCISGIQSSSTDGEWSDEASSLLREMLLSESICHASCASVNDDTCSIELYLPSSNSYPHKLLLDKGHGIAVSSCKQKDVDKYLPFTLQSSSIRETGDYRVIPVHFENPQEFYVQVANAEKLQQVFEFDALIQRLPVVQYANPIPEDSCCALFSDDVWYRAKVLSVKGTECCVYFYDYGNKATLPIKNLREMPEEMKSLEAQAIRTKLDNIAPVGENWTDEAKELMDSKVSFQPCILRISKVENGLVIGMLTVEESGIDIATLLSEAHLAKPQSSMKSVGSHRGAESIKESSSLDRDRRTKVSPEVRMRSNTFTLHTEKLAAPSTQCVIPVHFESPHEFYVQISNAEKIQQVYEFDALLQTLPVVQYDNPIPEDSCCALFSDDVWYRAKVLSVKGTECCVYFYDYGNKATLPITKLREMPEEMKSLEAQAIRTKLDNIAPVGENWTDEAKELMDSKVSFQPCILRVSKVENGLVIGKLTVEESDIDVATLLTEAQLAKPQSSMKSVGSHRGAESIKESSSLDRDRRTKVSPEVRMRSNTFTLHTEKLAAPSTQCVIPVHFESPHEFYVQISNAEKIQQVYEFDALLQTLPVVQYDNPIPEDSCCALFSDDVWYRAKVLSVKGTECCVYFYDYGNKATLPITKLREMPEEMKSLEAQAIRTKLDNIEPIGESWTDEAKELMDSNLSFKPCVLEVSKMESGLVIGKLTVEESDIDLATLLVEAQLGKSVSSTERMGNKIGPKNTKEDSSFDLDQRTKPATQVNMTKKAFTLTTEKLAAPSTQRVIPVHFESPHEFYVQIANAEKIQQVYEFDALLQTLPVVQYDNPIRDDSCCALFSDDVWYRAKVLSVKGTECCVYFYDYGNKATLPITKLREMPEEMKSLEAQAIRTKLDNIEPIGESWTDEAKELMDSNLSFKPCVLEVSKMESGLVIGKLTVEESDIDLATLLAEAQLGKSVSSTERMGNKIGPKNTKEDSSFDLDQRTKPATQVNMTRKAFTLTTEKLAAPSTQRVIPVHFESPHEFYVQIANAEKIQQVYEFDALLQTLPVVQYDNPIPEDSCCALFSDDVWYRAKVLSVKGTECCVYFYDYGNKATLPITKLREMPEEMKSLEAQAIRTKLDNIEPIGESWTDEGKEMMDSSLSFKPCVLNISNLENCTVSGSLLREGDGLDISKQLVVSCLASSDSHSNKQEEAYVGDELPTDASGQKGSNSGEEQSTGAVHHRPTFKQVKRNGATVASSHGSDSEKSSSDSVSGEHDFNSQRSKKFSFGQNSKDRNRSFATGRNGPISKSQDHGVAENGNKMRRNYKLPPFPSYPPFMFPPLFFGSEVPYSVMRGYEGESDQESQTSESHDSRGSSRGGRGSSFPWKRGTASVQGNPSSRGRGQALTDWVDALHQMSSFMNSSQARHSYGVFRHQDSFRGWRGARGRGRFHSMSRSLKPSHEIFSGHDSGRIPPSLCIGSIVECIVTCIEHPFHFYVKLLKDGNSVILSDEVYENAGFAQNVSFGMLCAAKASVTGQFFRAKVERIYSEERVLVRDVDSGVTEIVDLPSGLKQLLHDDASKPFQAVRCALSNVVPKTSDRWSVTATKYLKHRLVIEGKKVKVQICGEGSFAVRVSIRDPDSMEVSVEEDLVKMGFARFIRL